MKADDFPIVMDRTVVRFQGKPALDGFNLQVPEGSVFALLGDNGAGKSTSMKVLTGQIKPNRGSSRILGLDTWSHSLRLRSRIGYVPDRPKLYDWMTVSEIGWFTSGFFPDGFQARYDEWVERLRLEPSKKIRTLSKGGYARVGLALALAPEPDVLLLDEPTSGLDLLTRREFLANLVDFAAEGRTILISSHSIAELERAASHAAFVRDGKVILAAPLDNLRTRFRRIAMRCEGIPPDASALGTVLDHKRTGRHVQFILQDPDYDLLNSLREAPTISDFEDHHVSLEEVYAVLMGRPVEENPESVIQKISVNGDQQSEVRL